MGLLIRTPRLGLLWNANAQALDATFRCAIQVQWLTICPGARPRLHAVPRRSRAAPL